MGREWTDLIVATANGHSDPPQSSSEGDEPSGGFFRRLRENLKKTRQALTTELGESLFQTLDDETWEQLEEALIMADLGAPATARIVSSLEESAATGSISTGEDLREQLIQQLAALGESEERIDLQARPAVVLVVGVNGTGKTTTVGKLAWQLRHVFDLRVVIGAADTFRAAGVEQLEEWARRSECEFVRGKEDADPASVAFETVERAVDEEFDVAIIDTAGRLHTYENLMSELTKIRRVVEKRLDGAPHETLLVVDATTGQNGLRQAKEFAKAVDVSGVALTKLDGSAKGGIALAIVEELGIPVRMIGIGEAIEDLRPFDSEEFARALLEV